MKKLISLILILSMIIAFVSCGKADYTDPEATDISGYATNASTDSAVDLQINIGDALNESATKSAIPGATPKASVVTQVDLTKITNGFLQLVNNERASKGAQPLTTNSALTAAAKIRSQELLTVLSHTRPDGSSFETVIDVAAYPYSGVAENIQSTTHLGNQVFTGDEVFVGKDDQIVSAYTVIFNNFKNSPDHYASMINNDFNETGIGITYRIDASSGMAIFYIAQIFGYK